MREKRSQWNFSLSSFQNFFPQKIFRNWIFNFSPHGESFCSSLKIKAAYLFYFFYSFFLLLLSNFNFLYDHASLDIRRTFFISILCSFLLLLNSIPLLSMNSRISEREHPWRLILACWQVLAHRWNGNPEALYSYSSNLLTLCDADESKARSLRLFIIFFIFIIIIIFFTESSGSNDDLLHANVSLSIYPFSLFSFSFAWLAL